MMNEILRDMINEGKVAAFVDNVLVGTEIEHKKFLVARSNEGSKAICGRL